LVGETILAAVFVDIVARMIMSIDRITQKVLSIRPIRLIGSETVSPTSCNEADVSNTTGRMTWFFDYGWFTGSALGGILYYVASQMR